MEQVGGQTMDVSLPLPDPLAPVSEQPTELRARFTRVRMLGGGGSGMIWLARDNDLNREVALKEIRTTHANDAAVRQRFLKEAQIASQLEHPNIIPIHGLGYRSGDEPFLIMRYVHGRDLRQTILEYHSRPANQRDLCRLLRAFVGACNGVAFAHSRGVLHRDPKPANILLGDNEEVFVVDWGLAKVSSPQGSHEDEVPRVSHDRVGEPPGHSGGGYPGHPGLHGARDGGWARRRRYSYRRLYPGCGPF